ncbi:MAG: LD-carboxypeptidase [Chitinophagaceae bacterium]|nr:LD-carboxypeptidase [Chitinophagaceae bacterium]
MNRKNFLTSIVGLSSVASVKTTSDVPLIPVKPRYLKPGDTIGITSPAGYITLKDIEPAIQQMMSWGFRVKVGAAIGKRNFGFGGTDEERRKDMQLMLNDPSLAAIMCARGGYGIIRIIDKLNFNRFREKPKWIIGFSDATVFHSHLNRNLGIASIHSKMCNSFPDDWNQADDLQKQTIFSIRDALSGIPLKYDVVPSPYNKSGSAEGILVGGNLKTIESLSGTSSDLYTNGKILFVEDTGEYLYSIDRMFWNLKRTGKLIGLKGLIVGGFKIKPDDPGEEFGSLLQNIVLDKLADYNFPVCFDFPVGHQKNNFAMKCGVKYRMKITSQASVVEEAS